MVEKVVNIGHYSMFLRVVKLIAVAGLLLDVKTVTACPLQCSCVGKSVSCVEQGLLSVPSGIPTSTERLDLQRNNITRITWRDFAGLHRLRKLYLQRNQLQNIDRRAFQSLPALRSLYLDNNKIGCIYDETFNALADLEVLTLNNNNLTSLSRRSFPGHMGNLRTFRLYGNPLHCDCHLNWLADWLKTRPTMAVFAQCQHPQNLRGSTLAGRRREFTCNGASSSPGSCETHACPPTCVCRNGVVDCRNRGLTSLPLTYPPDVTEIRMEQNQIQVIPASAFAAYKDLQRIDLSSNIIREIQKDAFSGLTYLTSLVIYGNKITSLPKDIFKGLTRLQMLLLNANRISCLREDVFDGLSSLTLLSLYNNKLQTLAKGTLSSLRSIETLHLAKNAFICDCRLKWLPRYLKKNPVETSGAKCAGPGHVANKKIVSVKPRRMRCSDPRDSHQTLGGECGPEVECPKMCRCDGTTVDCSGQGLTSVPDNIPPYASELIVSRNRIALLGKDGSFRKLRSLKRIDLSHNQLIKIEEGAFSGAQSVLELNLNDNMLSDVNSAMFSGLSNIRSLMIRNNQLSCIGNHTFAGMSTIRHLSLYGNQVSTVLAGAFSSMTSLSTLNLLANPLHCDCHLSWLSTWLRNRRVASGNPRCAAPAFLNHFPVSDINSQDFRCSEEASRDPPTCIPARKCPARCQCKGTVVRCASSHLTSIPINDIPHDVTELYLEMNDIAEIPESINQFTYLTILDLSNNQIRTIRDRLFANLTRLTTLLLPYNRLRCAPARSFEGLRSLKRLNLHSNDLSTLPEGLFDDLTSLTHVGFGANPWYCDCNLRWFAHYFEDIGIARCSAPRRMAGRFLVSSPASAFTCQGPLDIAVAAKCNPCLSSPCTHNSTCRMHPVEYYQCECQPGFKGRHCEMPIDPCVLQPCLNGGTCRARNEVLFTCQCRVGFEGDRCQANVDDCVGEPCRASNASCIDGVNSYTCRCPSGWTGDLCNEKLPDPCIEHRPCQNGGTCVVVEKIDTVSYRCECDRGFHGANCSERVDACAKHKCENGGVCETAPDTPVGYRCNCVGSYRGEYCTTAVVDVLIQDAPCSDNDCQNGGECYTENGRSHSQCWCLPGYGGRNCEKLLSLNFGKNGSFIEKRDLEFYNSNITFIFSTTKLYGVILYKGRVDEREHVAVELYSGHVRLSVDLGDAPGSALYSQVPVNDGGSHKVEILLRGGTVSLKLDDGQVIRAPRPTGVLADTGFDAASPLFVGGVQYNYLHSARNQLHIRNSTSFTGCIQGLYINQSQVDFLDVMPALDEQSTIRPGCIKEGHSSTCAASRCRGNGQCAFSGERGITCQCNEGFSGENCERRSVCRQDTCRHGKCVEVGMSFRCECDKGFSGRRCERRKKVCAGVDCGHGKCVATATGYKCACRRRYTGSRCKTRITSCPGRRVKDFVRITRPSPSAKRSTSYSAVLAGDEAPRTVQCRSKRRFVNYVCSGQCQAGAPSSARAVFGQSDAPAMPTCCQPMKVRSKRLPMRCSDGSKMTHVVQKVRRCGCKACG